ncbi:hypothetical protein CEXT_235371 [Caerostris extrusa]|uniref:Secreted protein n=1 Tax=Caerostris extrusa TaxID=172846 RepID=A0AAV4X5R4_CAEEX|nr:hypothetical protein CEXT_235371 [Caerostris extrusa]
MIQITERSLRFCMTLLIVSWIRRTDFHVLTVGMETYTSDERFEALHLQKEQRLDTADQVHPAQRLGDLRVSSQLGSENKLLCQSHHRW